MQLYSIQIETNIQFHNFFCSVNVIYCLNIYKQSIVLPSEEVRWRTLAQNSKQ